MVSFLFGKRRRPSANRSGYSLNDYKNRIEETDLNALDFGKRRRMTRRRASPGSCRSLRSKGKCNNSGVCNWKGKRGCVRIANKLRAPDFSMTSGDDDLGSYADAAGIEFFGRRRRRRGRKGVRKGARKGARRGVRKVRRHRKTHRRVSAFGEAARLANSTKNVIMAFGKRRKSRRKVRKNAKKTHADFRRMPRKLPASIRKMCRKLKIKCTKKIGSRKVYKKLSVLKKQIARKMRKMRKMRRSRR